MILVFDLDDTLYPERDFVASGFRAVAGYLARQHGVPPERSLGLFWERFALGRDHIFDAALRALELHSARLVRRCVSVYRLHTPRITLPAATRRCLARFADAPLYVVTDGHKLVQRRKLQALGLERRLRCYVTHEHGLDAGKPSVVCFEKLRARERVAPEEVLYVGDDPHKDFVGLKPLGYRTLRVRQGRFRHLRLDARHEAHAEIDSLDALDPALVALLTSPAARTSGRRPAPTAAASGTGS